MHKEEHFMNVSFCHYKRDTCKTRAVSTGSRYKCSINDLLTTVVFEVVRHRHDVSF